MTVGNNGRIALFDDDVLANLVLFAAPIWRVYMLSRVVMSS